jgi:drug/metabolite transporter (DMT)-like permease
MNPQVAASLGLIGLSIITGVVGQTTIKMGISRPGAAEGADGLVGLVKMILGSPLVLLGLFFYGVGALAWIAALTRLDLSVAYPFLALNFVLIALSSWLVLNERIPLLRWVGIAVICGGILLVAASIG